MMRALSLDAVATLTHGKHYGENAEISSVVIDSRRVRAGSLFVALRGERVDGHDYLRQAAESGASAALVNRQCKELPGVIVDDSQRALADLARDNRRAFRGPLIALTGSSGKTSTKEMLAAILSCNASVLATSGNHNNELGVPLTLLDISPQHAFAVIEMGAAKAGDIRYLCEFAQPDVAILTNAQAAHLQGFGSLDGVAKTKGEIFEALSPSGLAVINADDRYYSQWQAQASHCRQSSFSLISSSADVYASDISATAEGSQFTLHCAAGQTEVLLPLSGRHMVANALAAAAAALEVGISLSQIAEGLGGVNSTAGRLFSQRWGGITVIDDSYNANPGSVRAAIEVLAAKPGKSLLVLGEMAELGPDAEALHRDVAAYARDASVASCAFVGEFADVMAEEFGDAGRAFADKQALLGHLPALLDNVNTVLVKGSRSSAMEEVVTALQQTLSGENG